MPADGPVMLGSSHSVKDTVDILAGILTAQGATVFARIDYTGAPFRSAWL